MFRLHRDSYGVYLFHNRIIIPLIQFSFKRIQPALDLFTFDHFFLVLLNFYSIRCGNYSIYLGALRADQIKHIRPGDDTRLRASAGPEDGLPLSHCVPDLQTGDYNVSAAVPPDYNPTTAMSVPVRIDPGDTRYVEFAAQPSAALVNSGEGGGTRSTALGILGLLLLAAAGGLAFYAARLGRKSPRWTRK